MTNKEDFDKALDITPLDWNLRLIYADWLEENQFYGDVKWQKWLVEKKKSPNFRDLKISKKWSWHAPRCSGRVICAILDKELVKAIKTSRWDSCHARFETRIEAEKAYRDYLIAHRKIKL